MEHPIVRRFLEMYPEHRWKQRSVVAYLAFKEMEKNEEFMRQVAEDLAKKNGNASTQSILTYRRHLQALVDRRYMHPKTAGMILAIHEMHKTRGNADIVPNGLVNQTPNT